VRATIRTRDHDLLLEIHIEILFTEPEYARYFLNAVIAEIAVIAGN